MTDHDHDSENGNGASATEQPEPPVRQLHTQDVDPEKAAQMQLAAARNARAQACQDELNEVLRKHRCALRIVPVPSMVPAADGTFSLQFEFEQQVIAR